VNSLRNNRCGKVAYHVSKGAARVVETLAKTGHSRIQTFRTSRNVLTRPTRWLFDQGRKESLVVRESHHSVLT